MKTGLRRPETAVIAVWESVTTVLLRQSAGEKKTGSRLFHRPSDRSADLETALARERERAPRKSPRIGSLMSMAPR